MIVYEGIKTDFINDVDLNLITEKISEKYKAHFGRSGDSQINSWTESMLRMRGVLADPEIPSDCGVAIEYNIPTTSKRIDFVLSGINNEDRESIVIVELKQWQHAKAVEGKDGLVNTFTGHANRDVTHPSYQAWTYASLIQSFNQTVQDEEIELHPCAFLHNYDLKPNDPINSEQYQVYIDAAPMFGSNGFADLRKFIKTYITKGDNREGLYKIENGKIKPSKMLQEAFASVLKGNKEFNMIDEQKVIYEDIVSLGTNCVYRNGKEVYVVEGGPGTGKSVLAIQLLNTFNKSGFTSFYVTKNSAPRNVFASKLKISKMSYMNNLFKGSGGFTEAEKNSCNVLIVDEAHRLNEKSGLFSNLGENQIKEIINAANFSVFFIDESQKVTLKDIGSVDEITKYAKEAGATIHYAKLESQFRCNGSDAYLAWLDHILEIRDTANYDLDIDYDFKVFDDPNEMRDAIIEKNKINNKSRIVAGYCWNWISEGKNNPDVYDIEIPEYNFKMSWNLGNTSTWAIDEESVNEAGCIHTCQGLEFDYVGVIVGKDMRYENGHIVTDYTQRASTDQSLKGIKSMAKKDKTEAEKLADQIIKNTYRTLMTRGMKGCYVYCEDKKLGNYIKRLLSNRINESMSVS
ncbi:MAG: DUF2075 domain-containing protein [Oceanobacillus sp.]|nr:DUF2075 domain-containing protein [Oceanobacillus sp.]